MQAILRGDSVIGTASITLGSDDAGDATVHALQLDLKGKQQGILRCKVGVLASSADYEVLQRSERRTLTEVARSLVAVLGQPHGIDALVKCQPEVLRHQQVGSQVLRKMLKDWIVRLQKQAPSLQNASEEEAMCKLARLMREAQQIVAMCAREEADGDDIRDITVLWIKSFFQLCAGAHGPPPALNEARLQQLLERAESMELDPGEALRAFGVALPEGTADNILSAVVQRLRDAAANEGDEMFTGEALVLGGRVTRDLGVVVRCGRRPSDQPHVFLYDLPSIHQWQADRGHDPSTRETLHLGSIVAMTLRT